MKSIIAASLGMMMVLSGAALGQDRPPERTPPRPADAEAAEGMRMSRGRGDRVMGPTDVPVEAPVGKSGRSYGPDVMAMIFAPVGMILAPITQGLHAVDAVVAPINVALKPLTGPLALPPGEPVLVPAPVTGPRK